MPLSYWDYITLLLLRPLFAVAVVLSFIVAGWWLAWKLVLVHVPLVQEIFGLRKKPAKPKPPTRRISKIYSGIEEARKSASKWGYRLSRKGKLLRSSLMVKKFETAG